MSDGTPFSDDPRAEERSTPLAERLEARARSLRSFADLTARSVCRNEPPSWGDVLTWLDSETAQLYLWAAEARDLTARAEF